MMCDDAAQGSSGAPNKYYLATLGCPKNEVDSDVWHKYLCDGGFVPVSDPSEADLLLVNTCAFIDAARAESHEAIEKLGEIKQKHGNKKLFVLGCLAQLEGERLLEQFPFVDGVFGNLNIADAHRALVQSIDANERVVHLPKQVALWYPETPIKPSTYPYAYLKIAEGCDNRCSYCLLPSIRGRYRSMPLENLLLQARHLVEEGFKEIILVAQETTRYGSDLHYEAGLVTLLEKLNEIPGDFVVRVLYTNPLRIDRRLVEAISGLPKVVKYLDIPLQHYDDDILELMGRRYTSRDIELLLEMIRSVDESIVLRTTFIVGFPGEDDEKFDRLLRFVERGHFLHIGVFEYSSERGTPAANLPGRVPQEVSALRRELLELVHSDFLFAYNQRLVGKLVDALVDEYAVRDGLYIARMPEDAPQIDRHIKVSGETKPGEWVKVRILKAMTQSFLGVVEEV